MLRTCNDKGMGPWRSKGRNGFIFFPLVGHIILHNLPVWKRLQIRIQLGRSGAGNVRQFLGISCSELRYVLTGLAHRDMGSLIQNGGHI